MKTVEDVRSFWENNPLFSGESLHKEGSREFFEEHNRVIVSDCFAGEVDERTFPRPERRRKVLDLGCGPGFWTVELARRGCKDITAADLTEKALELTKKRCAFYGAEAIFSRQNAENLTFESSTFSHVNCQGVIHHTPDTEACVREIARVLEPGGTASISVYFRGPLLRAWPMIQPVGKFLANVGGGLKGRGREKIFRVRDTNEIVRLYDGSENPIGKAFSTRELRTLCEPYFVMDQTFLHFFPVRSLPFPVSKGLHRLLDKKAGLLLYATMTKR